MICFYMMELGANFSVMGVKRGDCIFLKKGRDIKKGGMKKQKGADTPFRTRTIVMVFLV